MKLRCSRHACMGRSYIYTHYYTACYARNSRDTYTATNSNAIASSNSNAT